MILNSRIPVKYIIKSIWRDVLIVFGFSVLTYIVSLYIDFPLIPIAISSFLGTAISLILAFKLAQSYERWWEARKIWGAIVNDSRTLILQVKSFAVYDHEPIHPVVKKMAYRQMGWNFALGRALRKEDPLKNMDKYLGKEELSELSNHANIPLGIINLHTLDVQFLLKMQAINSFQQVQIDQTLVRLVESMGQAERIKNTVFPTTYRMYLHLFIYLFLGMLSVSIVELEGMWQIVILTLISSPILLLEKTATYLQDPFEGIATDTPVTHIARNIEINLKNLIGDDQITEIEAPDSFYLL